MTAGAHDAGGGFGRSAGANAARGIAVIAAAVLLGFFLMARAIDDDTVVAGTDSTTTITTAPAGSDTSAADSTTITTAPVSDDTATGADDTLPAQRAPSEVLTLALNGTDPVQSGKAGAMRDVLAANGYGVAAPKNADSPAASAVLFVEGYESDARAIATLLGVDPDAVVRPFDAASSPIADTQSAQVIVVVGNDGVITV